MREPPQRPPIAEAPISLVLLAYNAAAVVEETVRGWAAYLDGLTREYEILVADEGSTDQTRERAEGLQLSSVRVLSPNTAGVGAALRAGLAAARHPLFGYAECSTAYQPADLEKLLEVIDQVDVVTGFRPRAARRMQRTWKGHAFGWLVRLIFGVRLKDVDCPFKLFRRALFARLPIQSDGPFVHAEIMAKANFLGCLIAEVEVGYQLPFLAQPRPSSFRQLRAEAARVFRRPDFGPVLLPTEDTSLDKGIGP